MSLINPQLPKQYKNSKVLFEKNLDAWRTATEQGFAISNLNLTQLRKDCFLSTYDFDNDGIGNLPKSLQQQINDITTGAVPISGTTTNTWAINSDGNAVILSSAGLTATHTYTFPDLDGEIVTLNATQTLTNKTLTSPVINGGDITGAASFTTSPDSGVTITFAIDVATGSFGVPSGQKIFLDGTDLLGDTYIYEGVANDIYIVAGTNPNLLINATRVAVGGAADLIIQATKLLYLDGGGNTYITEDSSDNISFVSAAANAFNISSARSYSKADFWLDPTKRLYFDGGGDTFIYESSSNNLAIDIGGVNIFAGNTTAANFNLVDLSIDTTKKFYLDGGGDTYISETSNTITFTSGGVDALTINGTSGRVAPAAATSIYLGDNVQPFAGMWLATTTGLIRWGNAGFNHSNIFGSTTKLTLNGANGSAFQGIEVNYASLNPTADNAVLCGTGSLAWSGGNTHVAFTVISDERTKSDIEDSDLGLDFINALRPVSYKRKTDLASVHHGFIAQEVMKVLPKGYSIIDHKPEEDFYGIRYEEIIAPLVKAVKELSAKVELLGG